MRKSIGSLAIVLASIGCSLPLVAQAPPPSISAVFPPEASSSGGTVVTIEGANFIANIACVVPCPTTVDFGDTRAEDVVEIADTRIVVRAPARAAGAADITVTRGDGLTASHPFRYVDSIGSHYERMLLPVHIQPVDGAHGSRWASTLAIVNGGDHPVQVAHAACHDACPGVYPLTISIAPHTAAIDPDLGLRPPGEPPGRLIYVTADRAEAVAFMLRARDLSRQSETWGTAIPVVRAGEFVSRRSIHLADIPSDPQFRTTLRIYENQPPAGSEFSVTLRRMDDGAEIGQQIVRTSEMSTADELTPEPGFAQLSELRIREIALPPGTRLRIEVAPISPAASFWAFATVTHNETQHVTVVPPE